MTVDTWEINTPEDLKVFQQETIERHNSAYKPRYARVNLARFECSRGEFLRYALEIIQEGPLKIMASKVRVQLHQAQEGMTGPIHREGVYFWIDPGEAASNCPTAVEKPNRMRPVFSFMGWRVLDPEQNDSFGALGDAECRRAICPEPTCLREWDNNPYQGKIVTTGEKGRASLRARPCNRHQDIFEFTPGWYQRFADAYYAEPATPRSCTECGRRYTSHLWEYAWELCPICTHEGIGYMRLIDLRTNTMEFGRRLGLDQKAWEYNHLLMEEQEAKLRELLAFIQQANREWEAAGGDPNASRDLSGEYHRRQTSGEAMAMAGAPGSDYTGWLDPYGSQAPAGHP